MASQQSMAEFVAKYGIVADVERVDSNPNTDPDEWADGSRHWQVRLRSLSRAWAEMIVPFSQGPAHTEPPTAEDVLDALASDTAGYLNSQNFEDWCAEYGYDTGSRRAERTYNAVRAQAVRLAEFLGSEATQELAFETERL